MIMNSKDPKQIAILFNECINKQDIEALSNLMSDDHTFITEKGMFPNQKKQWFNPGSNFFKCFPSITIHLTALGQKIIW